MLTQQAPCVKVGAMKIHRWIQIRDTGAYGCARCDVKRFRVPILGYVYSIGWGFLSCTRPTCPQRIGQSVADDIDREKIFELLKAYQAAVKFHMECPKESKGWAYQRREAARLALEQARIP